MRALPLLAAGLILAAAGPALAAPDWTRKSPIRVTPGWIPDRDGTIVRMVPGARSGPKDAAKSTACGCEKTTPARP